MIQRRFMFPVLLCNFLTPIESDHRQSISRRNPVGTWRVPEIPNGLLKLISSVLRIVFFRKRNPSYNYGLIAKVWMLRNYWSSSVSASSVHTNIQFYFNFKQRRKWEKLCVRLLQWGHWRYPLKFIFSIQLKLTLLYLQVCGDFGI